MRESKDGQRHGNEFRMKRYDAAHEGKEPGPRAEAKQLQQMPDGTSQDRMEEEPDHGMIQQVAAEHGPAHTIHMTHDHENGMHHVHSVHPDGMEHHADHKSAMHAHHHAMHAAGVNPEGTDHSPEPEQEEGREPKDDFEAEELPA
jgi:hypothetical protein